MARSTPNTSRPFATPDLGALLDACGSSPEAVRQCVLACRRSTRQALDAELQRALVARGHAAHDLCARELTARVADVNVWELLQMLALGRKDAIIDVFHGALASRLWCSGGDILDAVSGRLAGNAAVYRILGLDHGELVADFRPVQRPRAVRGSTQALMLEALRHKDECAVLARRLGGTQASYAAADTGRSAVEPGSVAAALLDAFSGGARIDTVLGASSLADLTVLQAISSLVERGYLLRCAAASTPSVVPIPLPCTPPPAANDVTPASAPRRFSPARLAAATFVGLAVGMSGFTALSRLEHEPLADAGETNPPGEPATAPAVPETAAERGATPHDTAAESGTTPHDTSRELTTTVAALSLPGAAARASDAARATFAVQVAVEPSSAALWLDGARIATGELSMVLARDGKTHELIITAPEHHPHTYLFRDNAPPRAIRLVPVHAVP